MLKGIAWCVVGGALLSPLACSSDVQSAPSESASSNTCDGATPILQEGTQAPSGFVRCDDGLVVRKMAVTCELPAPVGDDCAVTTFGCQSDAECSAAPMGRCEKDDNYPSCSCRYGCASDADCDEGSICACGGVAGPRSRCIPADCDGEATCGGALCAIEVQTNGCLQRSYAARCMSDAPACRTTADCPTSDFCGDRTADCTVMDGAWQCRDQVECGPCG